MLIPVEVEVVEVVEVAEESVGVEELVVNKLSGTRSSREAGDPSKVTYAKTGVSVAVKRPSSLLESNGTGGFVPNGESKECDGVAAVNWNTRRSVVDNRENLILYA